MKYQEGYAELDGYRLYYQTYGIGFPILLLHGTLGSSALMNHTATWKLGDWLVERGFRVVAFDQHGCGKSSRVDSFSEDYFQKNVKDTTRVLDRLKINDFGIIGVSEGGTIALNLAINYPERVSIVVADSAGYCYNEEMIEADEDPDNGMPEEWRKVLVEDQGEEYTLALEKARKKMMGYFAGQEIDFFQNRLSEIKCPTFLAACTGDIYRLNRQNRKMSSLIPGVKIKIYRGGSHPVMWNLTDQFAPELDEFLIRVLKSPD